MLQSSGLFPSKLFWVVVLSVIARFIGKDQNNSGGSYLLIGHPVVLAEKGAECLARLCQVGVLAAEVVAVVKLVHPGARLGKQWRRSIADGGCKKVPPRLTSKAARFSRLMPLRRLIKIVPDEIDLHPNL